MKPMLMKDLLALPSLPAKEQRAFQALQGYAFTQAYEYLVDILVDLVQQNRGLEDRLNTMEVASQLHNEMIKAILPPEQYENVWKQCVGCKGSLQ